jgi:hypothetical protein
MRNRRGVAALVLTGAFALSGCGMFGGGEKKFVCPASFIAPDAGKEAVFKPGGRTLSDVSYGVEIAAIKSGCARTDKGLSVDTKLSFELAAEDPAIETGSFEYFVSIVDGQQHILTKHVYVLPFEFDPRRRNMTRQDELIENLPLRNDMSGGNYAVVVGLQLTPAQLEFNRAGNRGPAMSLPAEKARSQSNE